MRFTWAFANSGLELLVKTLQEQLSDLREDRDAWRAEAGKWQDQAEVVMRLLPAPASESAPAGQGKPAHGLWARLRGKVPANN